VSEIAILPSHERFRALARAGNVISVSAELIADSETPVSAFQKVDMATASLESAEKNEEAGRFFFVGIDPRLTIQRYGRSISIAKESPARRSNFRRSARRVRSHGGGEIMDLGHREPPLHGVQFHLKSILTIRRKETADEFPRALRAKIHATTA
jgi:anthranilate/para-aminobenzoate synthase component II